MTDWLDGCRAKLARSEEHLNTLETEYEPFKNWSQEIQTYDRWELFPDGNRWRVTYIAEQELPQADDRWGLIVGDAAHNARSALDHLACRFVELETPGADLRPISFPIRRTDPHKTKEPKKSMASYAALVEGMSDDHKEAIWKLQPFHDQTSPLSQSLVSLAALDNADKHQLCLPSVLAIGEQIEPVTYVQSTESGEGEMQMNDGAILRPHEPVARVRAFSGTDQLFLNIGFRGKVVYGGEQSSVGLTELREIRAHVVGIVESFSPIWT